MRAESRYTAAMEVMRRCKECRRVVGGHAGDACPYCGSTQLVTLTAPVQAIKQHPSVVTAAVTFFVGLFGLRLLAALLASKFTFAAALSSELLHQLQLLVGVATALYVVLRRREGDFVALFIVSFVLFCGSEGLAALSRAYGLLTFNELSVLFCLGLIVYSSLALIAGLADGPRQGNHHRGLLLTALGFLCLAVLRVFFQLRGGDLNEWRNLITSILIGALALTLGVLLYRSEYRRAPVPQPAAPQIPAPGPVLAASNAEVAATKPVESAPE